MTVGSAVDDEIDECVEVVIFAVDLAVDAGQIFGLHQLKLMPDRRDHAAITRTRELDKIAVALLHFLLNYAAPTDAIIVQFAVPFVIRKRNIVRLKRLLRHIALRPSLRALQIVGLAFVVEAVPGVEKVADVLECFSAVRV